MNKFIILTKVLLKNGSGSLRTRSRRSNMSYLILLIVLLPYIVTSTAGIYNMYGMLTANHLQDVFLGALLTAACAAQILLGMMYVLSIYYFSDDVARLITLPLKPSEILAAKFVVVNIFQYVLEAILLLPCLIAYGARIASPEYCLLALLAFLLLPVIPTVICSIISIIIMYFGRFFKSKDRVNVFAGLLGFAVVIAIYLFNMHNGRRLGGSFILENKAMLNRVTLLFPSNRLISYALIGHGALQSFAAFLGFIAVSAIAAALFLFLAQGFYLRGVIGISQGTSGGAVITQAQIRRYASSRPAFMAFAIKEWRTLLRTPAYLLNCVISGLVFPIILFLFIGVTMLRLPGFSLSPLACGVITMFITMILTSNMLSATAVSREGKSIDIIRSLPLRFKSFVWAKLLPGLILGYSTLLPICLLALIKLDVVSVFMVFTLSAVGIALLNIVGVFIDILNPNVEWDDETAAVKRNINVLIEMVASLVLTGIIAGAVFLLKLQGAPAYLFMLVCYLVLCAVAYRLLIVKGETIFNAIGGPGQKAQKQ